MPQATAVIDASSNGDNTIVAAPTDAALRVRVLGYVMVPSGTVNATFYSDTHTGTALTGTFALTAAGGPVSAPVTPGRMPTGRPVAWMECDVGKALVLNLNTGVGVQGHLVYETERA